MIHSWACGLVVAVLSLVVAWWASRRPRLPKDALIQWADLRFGRVDDKNYPLRDRVAIVTGSTSGIGLEASAQLFQMGALVIMGARSGDKCAKVVEQLRSKENGGPGELQCASLDTSDLDSVRSFASAINANRTKVNFLLLNAGISYRGSSTDPLLDPLLNPKVNTTSPQGFDIAFATNYLGHFLLVEMLRKEVMQDHSRIVSVSSIYHWTVNGRDLRPFSIDSPHPRASLPLTDHSFRKDQYSNTKLAQVLHVKELARRGLDRGIKIAAVCPGWVDTGIVKQESFLFRFIRQNAFSVSAGVFTPLCALLHPNIESGNWFQSSKWSTTFVEHWFQIFEAYGKRSDGGDVFVLLVLLFQRMSYGCHHETQVPSSPESYDSEMQSQLFEWTYRAVGL